MVCTKSSTELATDRIRSVARACVIVIDGPKNAAARKVMAANACSAGVKPPDT